MKKEAELDIILDKVRNHCLQKKADTGLSDVVASNPLKKLLIGGAAGAAGGAGLGYVKKKIDELRGKKYTSFARNILPFMLMGAGAGGAAGGIRSKFTDKSPINTKLDKSKVDIPKGEEYAQQLEESAKRIGTQAAAGGASGAGAYTASNLGQRLRAALRNPLKHLDKVDQNTLKGSKVYQNALEELNAMRSGKVTPGFETPNNKVWGFLKDMGVDHKADTEYTALRDRMKAFSKKLNGKDINPVVGPADKRWARLGRMSKELDAFQNPNLNSATLNELKAMARQAKPSLYKAPKFVPKSMGGLAAIGAAATPLLLGYLNSKKD